MTGKTKKNSKPKRNGGGTKSSRKGKQGIFAKLLIALLVVAMIFMATIMVVKSLHGGGVSTSRAVEPSLPVNKVQQTAKPVEGKPSPRQSNQKTFLERTIEGNWMSVMEGSTLAMKDSKYRIDFSGIDADKPIVGTYKVEGDLITFDGEGVYKIDVTNKNIKFVCQNDKSEKRKSALEFEWEWFE